MGTSTDAYLFYGYIWDEEVKLFSEDEDDDVDDEGWVRRLAVQRGHVDPWDNFVEPTLERGYEARSLAVKQWTDANRAELDAWHQVQTRIEQEFGVEIGYHCSDGFACPYLAITESQVTARRGDPQNLTGISLSRRPGWDELLDRFMGEHGIEYPEGEGGEVQEPGWFMASYWG